MKSFLFRLYLSLMKFCARFVKIKATKIVVLNGSGRSGSNGYLFAKYLKNAHPEYTVTLVEPWPSAHLSWQTWYEIGAAKFVLTTHQPFKVHKRQVNLQFWHGIPLKRMGLAAYNTQAKDNRRNTRLWLKTTDVVCSSSDLYETLMSACIPISAPKYQQLGFPRWDALQQAAVAKQQILKDLFNQHDEQAELGIYVPTFREELADEQLIEAIKNGNFLGLSDFDAAALNDALKKRHQYLIIKLHPYEMQLVEQLTSSYSNFALLKNDYLFANDIDLYELLGATDFLMTDFSSIYFDYLHLDRPIIFLTNYLPQYEKVRGLLIGPYQQVVPGPCVNNQMELVQSLQQLPQNQKKYESLRQYWLALTNQVDSSNYCEDIFNYLTSNF
ncbi:CDP-glycerol glycerophosphotransferase family protein [Lactobacillus sp. ESL0684]|uniref:CDP-glycerol glycerophosphotransferase family protein n=1 Tax=Lactobacillus sp. ESL0684 TaxID=2983213 RepID=UPI0023F80B5E|nr:CDP-glycerol glycerophosphotransferase family protein [Lactobacillus sp. ESL0684]WEV43209.1 CDP-glycerol glycerophosphotransferase family protein [Lactobacillus sp. ESL0684]